MPLKSNMVTLFSLKSMVVSDGNVKYGSGSSDGGDGHGKTVVLFFIVVMVRRWRLLWHGHGSGGCGGGNNGGEDGHGGGDDCGMVEKVV